MTTNHFATYDLTIAHEHGRPVSAVFDYFCRWQRYAKRFHDGCYWFFQTYEQIAEATGYSFSTVRRAVAKLRELGWVRAEKLLRHQYKQTYHYSLLVPSAKQPDHTENTDVSTVSTSNKRTRNPNKKNLKTSAEIVQRCHQLGKTMRNFVKPTEETLKPGLLVIESAPGIKRICYDDYPLSAKSDWSAIAFRQNRANF